MAKEKTTRDGRCFLCVQRIKYEGTGTWEDGLVPKHMIVEGVRLCAFPKLGRKPTEARVMKMREYQRKWEKQDRKAHPEKYKAKARRQSFRRLYGLTPEEVDSRILAQGGLCACCQRAPATDVDHNHDTKAFRGVLCGLCNRMIGQGQEDVTRLLAGAIYLADEPLKGKLVRLVREVANA